MDVKGLKECKEFIAGDGCFIRELIRPCGKKRAVRYSLARAVVRRGGRTMPHSLKTTEVYYVVRGKGRMHIGKSSRIIKPGDTVYIPPKAVQYVECLGSCDLEFLCIVDPAWRKEDEEVMRR